MIPEELVERAEVRAREIGWDVRWVDSPGALNDPLSPPVRKIIVTDPEEPEPFNKIELSLGDNQTWWSAALELGLIDSVEIDDLINIIDLQRAIEDRDQLVVRLNDQSTWLGVVQELGRAQKTLTLRCEVKKLPLAEGEKLTVKGEERVFPANTVREIVYLKNSTCPGCSVKLFFAPNEHGDTCPQCGAFIENEHFSGASQTCEACGAIRPCKCDVWGEAITSRAEDRVREMQRMGNTNLWECRESGHLLLVGETNCQVCGYEEPDLAWEGGNIYYKGPVNNPYLRVYPASGGELLVKGERFTIVSEPVVLEPCANEHRFPSMTMATPHPGDPDRCVDCGIASKDVPDGWTWMTGGGYNKATKWLGK